MSQSAEYFLRRLQSETQTERLEATRYFAAHAVASHENALRDALARERVLWIRAALKHALAKILPNAEFTSAEASVDRDDVPERLAAQVYADALETAASQLIHEIEPILGTLRLAAEGEVPNFPESGTSRNLNRLDDLLAAFSRLRRAASAPKNEEFSLDEMVQRCIQETQVPEGMHVQKAGPIRCIVTGDNSLISMCLNNGLRNAIEATAALLADTKSPPIAVAWGQTDKDYWISIVDSGVGFKGNLQRAVEISFRPHSRAMREQD